MLPALLATLAFADTPDVVTVRAGAAVPTFARGLGADAGAELAWWGHRGLPDDVGLVTGASFGFLPDVTCPVVGGDCRETLSAGRFTGSLRYGLPANFFLQGGVGAYVVSDAVRVNGERAGGTSFLVGPQASVGVALPIHRDGLQRRFGNPELRFDAHMPGFRPRETTFVMGLAVPIGFDLGDGPHHGSVAPDDCAWQVVERRLVERVIAWDDAGLRLRHESGRLDTVVKADEVDLLKESLVDQTRVEAQATAKGGAKLSGGIGRNVDGFVEAGVSGSASASRTRTTTTEHAETLTRSSTLTAATHVDRIDFTGFLAAQEVWRFEEVWAWRGASCPAALGGEVATRTVEHRGAVVKFPISEFTAWYVDTQAPGAERPDEADVRERARKDLAGAVAQGHWRDVVELPLPGALPEPLELTEGGS